MKSPALVGMLALLSVACADPTPPESLPTGPATGIAVVCSDWGTSTSLSLMDPSATFLTVPSLIHSGSTLPKVHSALSGDLVLPAQTPPEGILHLIDRYPNGVITTIDLLQGTITDQVNVAGHFRANPHDLLTLPDGQRLVTRYNPNPVPSSDPFNQGDDVVMLDTEGHIQDAIVFTSEESLGRPDRLAWVEGVVWVSLNRVSLDFEDYAPARLARIKLEDDGAMKRLDDLVIKEVTNCGGLAHRGGRVLLSCGGSFLAKDNTYATTSSALILFDGTGQETARLPATHPKVGATFSPYIALDSGGVVTAITYATNAQDRDRVIQWDPSTDNVETLFEGPGPWVLTSLVLNDADVPLVAIGSLDAPAVCLLTPTPSCVTACRSTGLPPRALGRYGF